MIRIALQMRLVVWAILGTRSGSSPPTKASQNQWPIEPERATEGFIGSISDSLNFAIAVRRAKRKSKRLSRDRTKYLMVRLTNPSLAASSGSIASVASPRTEVFDLSANHVVRDLMDFLNAVGHSLSTQRQ